MSIYINSQIVGVLDLLQVKMENHLVKMDIYMKFLIMILSI